MKSIVVEEVLSDIFNLIPDRQYSYAKDDDTITVTVPKPRYYFGDAKECNALIKKRGEKIYPLIFQTSNSEGHNRDAREVTTDLVLVLAHRNTRIDLLNTQRWATSYRNILMPLVDNVIQALSESGLIRFDGTYTLEKVPNYSETEAKDKNAFIDIVDAIIFRATITLNVKNKCINKNINFNK